MYTAVQVWALTEVRGTCFGGSKSRKLASNHEKSVSDHLEPRKCHAKLVQLFFHPHELRCSDILASTYRVDLRI